MKCEDCIEWEYFEGYGYGCFCMQTMTPIDADKCEFYADKRPDVPHSWKPSKFEPQKSDHKCHTCKHYMSGERDGSCDSYICKGYSNWESEEV